MQSFRADLQLKLVDPTRFHWRKAETQSKKCMVRHGASHKIKYFRVLLYMGPQAESRYTLEKIKV